MNENLQNVLADLAAKFGTSVEHLWTVMIAQARISGITSSVELVVIVAGWYALYRLMRYAYETTEDEIVFLVYLGGLIVGVASLIAAFCLFENIVTAFLNPEYWALSQILRGGK